jgi:hypothetical protein
MHLNFTSDPFGLIENIKLSPCPYFHYPELDHYILVYPPNTLLLAIIIVKVGPLSSHLSWNILA